SDTSATCTHPAGNAGTLCRAAAGPCDITESCTGSSTSCPTDTFLPSTTVCRASATPCDTAESCTGSSAACPADTYGGGTVCVIQNLGTNGNEVSGKTISITPIAGSVSAGDVVIVTLAMDPDPGTVSCADTEGNTYLKDADWTNGSGTSGVRTVVFSARATTALQTSDTIT